MGNKQYIKILVAEVLPVVAVGFFLYNLHQLNKLLLSEEFTELGAIMLLSYNEMQPVKYFAVALALAFVSIYSIIRLVHYINES